MFFFNDTRINKWLLGLNIKTTYGRQVGCTEGDIDSRLIYFLRIMYNNGMAYSLRDSPKNSIYITWPDWLEKL